MVTKINVSLQKEILERLDKAARESHTARSAFIARAIEHVLEEKEEAKRRLQRQKAAERIIKLADDTGPWDGTSEVLKWRQRH
jgi:metal-responsive CopG/Arc/MetJ family transcriptional regulator